MSAVKAKEFLTVTRAVVVLLLAGAQIQAAQISSLFNTGVSETGALLEANQVDPHYTVTISADPSFPGPEAYTLIPGFPVGPWLAEGPNSRWIAAGADQSVGNEPGFYTFATTFDLTGFDLSTIRISGQMAADNFVRSVLLNGVDLGLTAAGFGGLVAFQFPVDAFYQDGTNTLEFVVENAPPNINPGGFRVEFDARGTTAEDLPSIVTQPRKVNTGIGSSFTLTVGAEGAAPLSYQWLLEGEPISGATESSFTVPTAARLDSGNYSVLVSNLLGSATSDVVRVRVVEPLPGLWNTGVDETGVALFDYSDDAHYVLSANPNDPTVTVPVVQNSFAFPIIEGPWLPNSPTSAWIGPAGDTPNAASGIYVYRVEVDLTGKDPATAFIAGQWASDNGGVIALNGAETSFISPGFGSFSDFEINSGFISGMNQLEFRVTNDGAGFTGLRVEGIIGTADEQTNVVLEPRIAAQPQSRSRFLLDSVSFDVVVDGAQPLSYQWFKDGNPITGATTPNYTIARLLPEHAGSYSVTVTNSSGSAISDSATLTLSGSEFGVFSTGVDSTGALLPLGQKDPHYILVNNPDANFPGNESYALSGAPFPTWLVNSETSQWIGHRSTGVEGTPGSYRYRLIFNIPAEDVATAAITGQVATDDGNQGVFLNGTAVDFPPGTGFSTFADLNIPAGSPFVAGLNSLDIIVSNGGAAANPTGLRIENLTLSGVTIPEQSPTLAVTVESGSLRIAWPSEATGYVLQETTALPGGWINSPAAINVEGNLNTANVELTGEGRFFRLTR